jgi:hypothetical protein
MHFLANDSFFALLFFRLSLTLFSICTFFAFGAQLHAIYHLTCAFGVYTLIVFATLYNFVLRRGLCADAGGRVSSPASDTAGAPPLPTLQSVRVQADIFPFYAVVIKDQHA